MASGSRRRNDGRPQPSSSLSPPLPPPSSPPPGSSRRRNDGRPQLSSPPSPPPSPPAGSIRRDDSTLLTSAPPPPPMPWRSLHPRPPPPMPQRPRLHMERWRDEMKERETRSFKTTRVKTSSSSIPRATEHEERERDSLTTILQETTASSSCVTQTRAHEERERDSLTTTLQETTASSVCVTQTRASDVSSLSPTGLFIKYFVRVDKEGLFHIYPDHGGPFQSLQKAQEFIDLYHVVERQNVCMDGLSAEERLVRCTLYWPHDGTRKNSAEAFAAMETRRPVQEVVKALLDKYNEENSRLGDSAYKLKDIVSYQPCFDGKGCPYRSYSHLNMTMKTRGEESKLFFAEVTCMVDEDEKYVLTCICAVAPDDNGECRVCGDKVKHPSDADYKRGRFKPHVRCCSGADAQELYDELVTVHGEAWLKEQEARVRQMIKEAQEAFKADFIGEAKYVVPAKRK